MKHCLYILLFLIVSATTSQAQRSGSRAEQGGGGRSKGGFSLSSLSSSQKEIPDSLLIPDSVALKSKSLTAYRLSPSLGEPYVAPLDTSQLNFGNSTLVEAQSLAIGYLANVGSPAQTRIFGERKEPRDFIFADAYNNYITTPENAYFYDTKIPYTNVMYTTAGGSTNKEEQLKATLTMNFGKKINVGGDFDYIYGRGHYKNNGDKLVSYRLFGSYKSDRYELHAYLSNFNFINYENGGLTNDSTITHPDEVSNNGTPNTDTKSFPIRYPADAWNRVRGKQYFFTQRYNLGYKRELDKEDAEGNPIEVFIPVSSIIHTFEYEDNRRRFYSKGTELDSAYVFYDPNTGSNIPRIYGLGAEVNDQTSTWKLKNTFGLALREGFQDWAKFGLTAFVSFEKRKFQLEAEVPGLNYGPDGRGPEYEPETLDYPRVKIYDEFSTYIGAELAKRQGSILTYNARGELCVVGSDLGEFRLTGDLQTKFKLFNKEVSIKANGHIKNTTPAFYLRHNHSRYFWWDNDNFNDIQQIYAGGEINIASTRTTLSAGVESIQNYIFINKNGLPQQYGSNLQVVSARIKQDFRYRAFGWENEACWQMSKDKDVLPLPVVSAYSNMYLAAKVAKVLTVQLGAELYYNTAYYAPYYEPATQQFQVQDKAKVGGYPLVNAYVNFHLKQARFFVMAYNLSSKFVEPNYFSLLHYPLNPMVLKMGIAVRFNN